jgi:hypothetical protein
MRNGGMKSVFLLIFTSHFCLCFAQVVDSSELDVNPERSFAKGWVSQNSVWAIYYGFRYYQLNRFNSDIQSSFGSSFNNYLGSAGASYSGSFIASRKFEIDMHVDYALYHSAPIILAINDSSRYYLRGFHFGMDGGKDLFPRTNNFDLLLAFGFNAGRLLFGNRDLTVSNKTNRRNRYQKPFFAPKLSVEQRVIVFKHFSISTKAEWQWDLTSPTWKVKNESLQKLSEAEATGYSISLALGWRY